MALEQVYSQKLAVFVMGIAVHCLIWKDMDRDTDRNKNKESTECPMFRNPDSAIKQSDPESCYRDYLDMKRNRLMHKEIWDVPAETRMIQQPDIQFSVATKKQGSRKQQKRSRW